MCQFKVTYYACGEIFVRGSSYRLCTNRGQGCKKELTRREWNTPCPALRKALGSKLDLRKTALPACCRTALAPSQAAGLCLKCNPAGVVPDMPSMYQCKTRPDCMRVVEPCAEGLDAQAEFEKVVKLWPPKYRTRYFRRKDDKSCLEAEDSMNFVDDV